MNTDHRNQMLEAMEQARDAVAALGAIAGVVEEEDEV